MVWGGSSTDGALDTEVGGPPLFLQVGGVQQAGRQLLLLAEGGWVGGARLGGARPDAGHAARPAEVG